MKSRSDILEEYEIMKEAAQNPEDHIAGVWARALAWVLEIREEGK